MHDSDRLAERFEEHRSRLTAVAYRLLGSSGEADDAVQEAWLRLSRSDPSAIENLRAWLTTVVSRVCLNMLQARRSRPEVPLDPGAPEPAAGPASRVRPRARSPARRRDRTGVAGRARHAGTRGARRLRPARHVRRAVRRHRADHRPQRPAARQLASRARRRVQGQDAGLDADRLRQAELVDAFLAAARNGDFAALLAVLDPDVVLRADETAVRLGAAPETRGAAGVGRVLPVRARSQAGAPRWGGGGRLDPGRPRAGRLRLHGQRRADHGHRPHRRPRAPEPVRPGDPGLAGRQPLTERPGTGVHGRDSVRPCVSRPPWQPSR